MMFIFLSFIKENNVCHSEKDLDFKKIRLDSCGMTNNILIFMNMI